jgi:EAL domain-containing protein (putative c-di-GMP-specific phosphodiesterase class I)
VSDPERIAALRRAVEQYRIELVYQPKLELATGRLVGVEALARWTDPELGPQDPGAFIALAEEQGLIGALTDAQIIAALRQWLVWRDQGLTLGVAVNISPLLLGELDFPDRLQRLCQQQGVPCEHLTIELTEGATQHVNHLMDTLTRIRIKGIRAAIDDFGTGYSSLLQLRQLPFTELKVDKWFVDDAMRSGESALIIRSIIDLAHALGLNVTAEGIETEEQLDLLAGYGCNHGQGALFAMAMPGPALAPWAVEHGARWRERRARSVLEA